MRIDRRGMTALHYAAFYSKIDIIKFLLDNGAGKRVAYSVNKPLPDILYCLVSKLPFFLVAHACMTC